MYAKTVTEYIINMLVKTLVYDLSVHVFKVHGVLSNHMYMYKSTIHVYVYYLCFISLRETFRGVCLCVCSNNMH